MGFLTAFPNLFAQGFPTKVDAQKTLLVSIEHPRFTLILEKFDKTGLQGISSSSGPEFKQVGGKLSQIMEEVFGQNQYEFGKGVNRENYFLTLKHPGQERSEEFLKLVLDTWVEEGSFNIQREELLMVKTCIRLEDRTKLKAALYQTEKGILQKSQYSGQNLEMTGYTLEEIAARISYETKEMYAMDETGIRNHLYKVRINLKSANTIRESLMKVGLKTYTCKQMTTLIKIPDEPQLSMQQ